jgi:voltage-gated potassium channel
METMIRKLWDWTLMLLALLFLYAFSYPAFTTEVTPKMQSILDSIQWISWLAFAFDLLFSIWKAEDKKAYVRSHPLELLAVFLPFLRPLRLMRLLSFGSMVLSKVSVGRSVGISFKVAITSFFLAYVAAIQITIIERPLENANIKTFGDGFWWAITTVTTVGYGDRFPVSTEGRFIAFCLMILGISLLGVLTATVAAWFVRMSQDDEVAN